MSQPFAFAFSGDDIDGSAENDLQHDNLPPQQQPSSSKNNLPSLKPQRRPLRDFFSTLPSRISYSTLCVPLEDGSSSIIKLPRRELFDVRVQLMAEEEVQDAEEQLPPYPQDSAGHSTRSTTASTTMLIGGNDDIITSVYEGGLKTWECALDLVKYLGENAFLCEDEGREKKINVVELGCGTALPSISILQHLLLRQQQPPTHTTGAHAPPRFHFVLADYNPEVLRLVTLPNVVLSWAMTQSSTDTDPQTDTWAAAAESDLEITPALLARFELDLQQRGIVIDTVSGGWGDEFLSELLPLWSEEEEGEQCSTRTRTQTLVLASETIYSPESLPAFIRVLAGTVGRGGAGERPAAVGLVAAKKVYFGVGGGVDDFVSAWEGVGGRAETAVEVDGQGQGQGEGEGVKRVVLSVHS
ncbi:MAG: hypothetical protein M1816_006886 [Peltula sp. TS41687]|nr:MAG: hypothetical protein M1816_006886 [Peltula sp. TS41687]